MDASEFAAGVCVIIIMIVLVVMSVDAWDKECDMREAKAAQIVRKK